VTENQPAAKPDSPGRFALEAAGYLLTVAIAYALVPGFVPTSVWWPPTGALIAWLLLRPRRHWPWILAVAVASRVLMAALTGRVALTAATVSLGACAAAVLTVLVLRRYARGRRLLSCPNDILALVTVALLVTGPLAAAGLVLSGRLAGDPPGSRVDPLLWALGDSLGALLVTPLVLSFGDARRWWADAPARPRMELAALLLTTALMSAAFGLVPPDNTQWGRPFQALLVVGPVYAALRFGLFAVTWTQAMTGLIMAWGLTRGLGVMSSAPTSLGLRVLSLQAFLVVGVVGVMLIAAAFDSQRRATARARESEAHFKRLVDNAPVALLVEDADAPDRPYVNPRLAVLFGVADDAGGIDGWWARTGVMPSVRAALDEVASGVLGPTPPMMTDLRGADGQTRHVELNVSVVGARRITAFTDLTDRLRLEAELRQAHKLEALGTLAGGVAHDFNNLLAAVLGNIDLARRALPRAAETAGFLGEAERAGARAAAVVRQILTFSRREEQARQVLTLGPVLHEAVSLLRGAAGPRTRIVVNETSEVPTVLGDATQLHQLIVNLGQNALHAMRGTGGTLTIELTAASVTESEARRRPELREGRYAKLTVKDTGHGMAGETLERIFEPFFTTKQVGEGTGLGLAVVHGVVRGHDGAISAHSTIGVGSTFEVMLPAVTTPASVPIIVQEETPSGRGLRVLVVDDEPALARIAEKSLGRAGCVVRALLDGASALDVLRADPQAVDVLVTDLTMPGMSGLEVASEARRVRPDLPVLLVSGYSAMLTLESVQAEGIQAILQKPYTPDELARAVMSLVPETAGRA
jgi:signal transduction histidine kinase/ActR/RegA family two-component response regulator